MYAGRYRSIYLTCELTQSDNFLVFVRFLWNVLRVTSKRFCRDLRGFNAWQVSYTNVLRVYFINPPACILLHVSPLWSHGETMQPPLLAPAWMPRFASRRVDRTTKAGLAHYIVIYSRWFVSRRKARCGGSGACDIRSLRASTRSFPAAVLCPASQMLRDDFKKCVFLLFFFFFNTAQCSFELGFIINCKKIFRDFTDFFFFHIYRWNDRHENAGARVQKRHLKLKIFA